MNNLDDLKQYSTDFICKLCAANSEHLDVCPKCFYKDILPNHIKSQPIDKWREMKRLSYNFLFIGVPLLIIGVYFGFQTQVIIWGALMYGLLLDIIIDWCIRKF